LASASRPGGTPAALPPFALAAPAGTVAGSEEFGSAGAEGTLLAVVVLGPETAAAHEAAAVAQMTKANRPTRSIAILPASSPTPMRRIVACAANSRHGRRIPLLRQCSIGYNAATAQQGSCSPATQNEQ
jgi:hypothetical protein